MLLKQYKRVMEIDDSINDLHEQLRSLYSERSTLTVGTEHDRAGLSQKIKENSVDVSWEQSVYAKLHTSWQRYTADFPLYEELHVKLTAAHHLIDTLHAQSIDAYEVIIIPPSKILNSLSKTGIFEKNNIYVSNDLNIINSSRSRSWHVYVVMVNPLGLPFVSFDEFKKQTQHVVSGLEMTSFNVQHYAAFLLAYNQWVDQNSWCVLTTEADYKKNTVPCVSKVGGSYQFELDALDVLIGRNHFRPVIEIK